LKYVDSRPSFKAIKESQSNPLTMQKLFGSGNNNHPIDMDAVQRIIEKGREQMRKTAGLSGADWNRMSWPERMAAMGKADSTVRFSTRPSFPPESANSTWTRQLANTGAANNWGDENTQRPATEQVGGFTDSRIGPNDARIRAAVAASGTTSRDRTVAAIQMDWQRKKQQMAASFAARRAARDNDKGTP